MFGLLLQIEKYVLHILDNPDMYKRLSEKEQELAKSYTDAIQHHFAGSILDHMPPSYDGLLRQSNASETDDMIPRPDVVRYSSEGGMAY